MASYVRWFARFFCTHPHDLRRAGGGRMWLECADCGRETRGIEVRPTAVNAGRRPTAEPALVFVRRMAER